MLSGTLYRPHGCLWRTKHPAQCRIGRSFCTYCSGMHVPSDSFSGMSPERKAAQAMVSFFTFAAVRIVLAQLEGSGRGGLGSYNAKAHEDLLSLLDEVPVKDGDAWIETLMHRNEMLGVRIMEVRAAYAKEDFEWHNFQRLAVKELTDGNTKLMRKHASEAFKNAFQTEEDEQNPPEQKQ